MEDKKIIKHLLVLFFLSLSWMVSQAQAIEIKKVFAGYRFIRNENPLSNRELIDIMQAHPSALVLLKKARSIDRIASPITGGGAVAFAFWGTDLLQGKGFNAGAFGISVGLYAIGFHLHAKADRKTIQAINLFNNKLSHIRHSPEFNIVARGYDLGLRVTF